MHVADIAAMLGCEGRDVLGDFLHHQRIGLRRDIPAAEALGQGHDAERDRHPCLDPRRGVWLVRIALDPDQFGRSAADVEQDGAAPIWIEQRRAAEHRERGLGLAIDDFQPDAGLGRDAVAKAGRVGGRAAGLGRDQPQPPGFAGLDLIAANAQRGDGALDRGIADTAGRRDSLAQPDDPRERIDHTKAVARRTGDQQPAIIGAEVERGIDAGSRSRRTAGFDKPGRQIWPDKSPATRPLRAFTRSRAVAKPRVVVHQNVFPRPIKAGEEFRSRKL